MVRAVLATFCLAVALLLAWTTPQAQAQTTVRPYKFGFNIAEQQHRSEKRDEKGIVMGEFGFITADGIYHVTVYATDEEGKFRILAMKSYPYENPPKTLDMIVKPKAKPPPSPIAVAKAAIAPVLSPKKSLPKFNFNTAACSGCFLKNSSPPKAEPSPAATPPKSNIRPLSQSLAANKATSSGGAPTVAAAAGKGKATPSRPATKPAAPRPAVVAKPQTYQAPSSAKSAKPASNAGAPKFDLRSGAAASAKPGGASAAAAARPFAAASAKPSKSGSATAGGAFKPSGAAAAKGSGGSGGSSAFRPSAAGSGSGAGRTGGGASAKGGDGDLYRFKYVLDYNGHSETGAHNGNKEGNYFAIGDDNVQRTIDYVANENGYQPRIHWRKVDAVQSKENTLKEYEFVWFNKP